MIVKAINTSKTLGITQDKYYRVLRKLRGSYLIYTDKGNKQLLNKPNFVHRRKFNHMFWVQ